MFVDIFSPEQIAILTQIIFIDLVLAGDNAIIIGMVASKFPLTKKKNNFLGYWWCCHFKNNFNFIYCLSFTNYGIKINWRYSASLYCLQIIQRCYFRLK